MNTVLSSSRFAAASTEPAGPVLPVETALLIILSVGLVLAVKALFGLHRRVAVLSAVAVPETPTEEHRIVAISTDVQNLSWAWEGRRQILGSHQVR